jgi:hypothetical protein
MSPVPTDPVSAPPDDPGQSSSSSVILQEGFGIEYASPGTEVIGDYVADDIAIGSNVIKNATFAVATRAEGVIIGIMGIGFDSNESPGPLGTYLNIPDLMVKQGLISRRVYSIWLNDIGASPDHLSFRANADVVVQIRMVAPLFSEASTRINLPESSTPSK